MSQQPPQDQHDLAQVLNRINALSGNARALPEFDEAIPLLTEIYDGVVPDFSVESLPIADELKIQAEAAQTLSPELISKLMAEMAPLIQEAVKKAVKAELQHAHDTIGIRLEAELTQVLRLKLQTALKG